MVAGNTVRLGVGGVADKPTVREWSDLDAKDIPDALNDFAWELGGGDDIHATARYRREIVRRIGAEGHRGGPPMRVLKQGERHRVRFTLNGEAVEGYAEPRMLLTDFIRHEIGATGTHVGCEHGICGACTIFVDKKAVRACLMLAVQADGKSLETVESLADKDGKLSILQAAFHRNFALQCGFCTPGFLMTLVGISCAQSRSDRAGRARGLSGNICRCTGYAEIVNAALEAAREMRAARSRWIRRMTCVPCSCVSSVRCTATRSRTSPIR